MNKILHWKGQEVFYQVIGKGGMVVLVHGFAEDSRIWENQITQLLKDHTLIIPDLPGSGRSATQAGECSMESMAECIRQILLKEMAGGEETENAAAVMIGHSMGGYITLAFAEKYPGMLKAIGLVHSIAYADSNEKILARRKSIEFIHQYGAAKFIEQSTPNLFSNAFREREQHAVNQIISRYSNFPAQSLVQYYEAMMRRPDRTHILKEITKPVLFIMGKHDNAVPFDQSLQQSYLPSISFIHILEHSGHMGMMEESEKTTQMLQNFLKECEILTH